MADPKTFARNLRWLIDFDPRSEFEIAEEVSNRLCRGKSKDTTIKVIEAKMKRWTSKGLKQIDGKNREQIDALVEVLGLPHLVGNYNELWSKLPDWEFMARHHFHVFVAAEYIKMEDNWLFSQVDEPEAYIEQLILECEETDPKRLYFLYKDGVAAMLEENRGKEVIRQLMSKGIWMKFRDLAKKKGKDADKTISDMTKQYGVEETVARCVVTIADEKAVERFDDYDEEKYSEPAPEPWVEEIDQVIARLTELEIYDKVEKWAKEKGGDIRKGIGIFLGKGRTPEQVVEALSSILIKEGLLDDE